MCIFFPSLFTQVQDPPRASYLFSILVACVCFLTNTLVMYCVQLSIRLSKFFRDFSYKVFGLSCEALAKQDALLLRHAYSAPQVELQRPAQERWSEEYIERAISRQATVRVQYIWHMMRRLCPPYTKSTL